MRTSLMSRRSVLSLGLFLPFLYTKSRPGDGINNIDNDNVNNDDNNSDDINDNHNKLYDNPPMLMKATASPISSTRVVIMMSLMMMMLICIMLMLMFLGILLVEILIVFRGNRSP